MKTDIATLKGVLIIKAVAETEMEPKINTRAPITGPPFDMSLRGSHLAEKRNFKGDCLSEIKVDKPWEAIKNTRLIVNIIRNIPKKVTNDFPINSVLT
jgi:hypothetical protein